MSLENQILVGDNERPTPENPFIFTLLIQRRELESSAIVLVDVYEPPRVLARGYKKEISPYYNSEESGDEILEAADAIFKEIEKRYPESHERHEKAQAFITEARKTLKEKLSGTED